MPAVSDGVGREAAWSCVTTSRLFGAERALPVQRPLPARALDSSAGGALVPALRTSRARYVSASVADEMFLGDLEVRWRRPPFLTGAGRAAVECFRGAPSVGLCWRGGSIAMSNSRQCQL